MRLKVLFLAVTATLTAFSVAAQEHTITLPTRTLTAEEVFENIGRQTDYMIAVSTNHTDNLTVKITKSPLTVNAALDALFAGSGMGYQIDGNYILIVEQATPQKQSTVAVNITRNVAGTVVGPDGNALEGITVEVVGTNAKAVTNANGRFSVAGVPAGNHVVRLSTADGDNICYREIAVPTGGDAEVRLVFDNELMREADNITADSTPAPAVKSTAYFIPQDNTIKAFADEAKTEYTFISTPQRQQYLPQVAVKTNLLYLATTTPNVAVEFGLAKKWTMDVSVAFNPFKLSEDGINRFWFVQPEVRYWFCNRFERHFIGLHGIYGDFNIGNMAMPLTHAFDEHRYDGWAAGAGLSYGYHLPMGKRWAWEFTVGAGYVYMDYDKYRCYDCDEFEGNKGRHYFGPTKAGVSLIFMIR